MLFSMPSILKSFEGMASEDISSFLTCMNAKIITPQKNEIIFQQGQKITQVGVVIEGEVHILKDDSEGNRLLLSAIGPGEIFGESHAGKNTLKMEITILAAKESQVLLLDFYQVLKMCRNNCHFHKQLIENMMYILTEKNLRLMHQLEFLAKRSARSKVLSFLEMMSFHYGPTFNLPLNREKLAEYLFMDRSTLSHIFSDLKKEGIITIQKNKITLFKTI